jgi:hypothetical protein
MIDLFKEIVVKEKQHNNFKLVLEGKGYEGARKLLNKVFNSTTAIDKNFIQQFQSTGFNARLWEL